jgi:penicillin-binding protein 1A
LQAALVAIDNRTGAIRAIVGSRDYSQSKYSRALLSKRQIGSTFKPFVYAAAYQRGMLPGTQVDDSKIAAGELRNAGKSAGRNGRRRTPMVSTKVSTRVPWSSEVAEYHDGANRRVCRTARSAHCRQPRGHRRADARLSGGFSRRFESTVKEITAAYSIFPNHGVLRPPHLIARVEDEAGHIIYQAEQKEQRVVNPDSAWMVSDTLQQVMKTGTAAKAASMGWKKPGAGKTGTTNDFFDAWFVGYTSTLTCGVWVGMDKPQTIMAKGYGSALALPVWVDFMQSVPEKSYPAAPFDRRSRWPSCVFAQPRAGVRRLSASTSAMPTMRICRVLASLPGLVAYTRSLRLPRRSMRRSRLIRRQPQRCRGVLLERLWRPNKRRRPLRGSTARG